MLEKVKYLILKGLGLGLTLVLVQSCISNKRITYLQNLPGNVEIGLDEYIPYAEVDYKYVLQPFDIVSIDFASSNEDLIKAFEYQGSRSMRGGGGGGGGASDIFYFTGYSIDQEGYIELPQLGKILIGGMVEEEAQNKVQAAINEFF